MSGPFWTPLAGPPGAQGPPGASAAATVGTTLPASPTDQQEAILVDSLTAPTYAWRFKYLTAITGTNKWLFIGGGPLVVQVDTNETTQSTTYAALATPGPIVPIPRAGDYVVSHGFTGSGPNGNYAIMSYDIGATAAVDSDSLTLQNNNSSVATNMYNYTSVSRTRRKLGLPVGSLTAKYRTAGAPNWQITSRWMSVIPVLVS